MTLDADFAKASPEALIAATLRLLSCSAAQGASRARALTLASLLGALAERRDTGALLAHACDELAEQWLRVEQALEDRQHDQAGVLCGCPPLESRRP